MFSLSVKSNRNIMEKFTLLTDFEEPSDEQLSFLMKEVAEEVKRKSLIAEQALRDAITLEISKIKVSSKNKNQ